MIQLSKSGNAIKFTFDENSGYLQNGTIDVPVNSLSLILDESNMATFRKSASNDIFVSALVGDFGMSKSELEAWYKANMVGSTGGGGGGVTPEEVQGMIDESISGKADTSAVTEAISAATDDMATQTWVGEQGYITGVDLSDYATLQDIPDVSNYFDGAEYDSGTTRINFYHGNTVKAYIDASAFIVDGMIDDVRIETISGASYLVIDFNTASGKEDIKIPLTDIFDPSNYYTKAEVDASLSGKADTSAVTASINAAVSGKQDTLIEGRAIDITNNTISLDLPISAGTGNYSIQEGFITKANGDYSHAEGFDVKANGYRSHAEGINTQANGNNSHTEGFYTIANGENSHAEGKNTLASGNTSHAEGINTIANNKSEHASGQYNVSSSASTTFGDSGNTLFSVGNGTANDARHNAFEIRQNGDIYFSKDGSDVKLQDSLFSGSYNDLTNKPTIPTSASQLTNDAGYITSDALSGYAESSAVTEEIAAAVSGKVDTSSVVTAVTSASTDSEIPTAKAVYDAVGQGGGSGSSTVELTQAEYDALVSGGTVDPTTYYIITDATPIDISNYYTSAQTDSAISAATSGLQETLVSGTNIKTINNESILGSGNITIQGGGGVDSGTVQTMIDESISGKVDTSSVVTAVTSASTDSEIPTAKAVYDAVGQGGGGGGSYSAGYGINIDTGNTISLTVPISGKSNVNLLDNLVFGADIPATTYDSIYIGKRINGYNSYRAIGINTKSSTSGAYSNISGDESIGIGCKVNISGGTKNKGAYSIAIGNGTVINGVQSIAIGSGAKTEGNACVAIGNNTIASGTTKTNINNQLTIDTSNQVYISNSANTTTYCLQTKLETTEAALGGLKLQQITQAAYDALVSGGTVDSSTLYIITNVVN